MGISPIVPLLIIVLPFVSFIICAVFGHKLRERAALVALSLVGLSSLLCLLTFGIVALSAQPQKGTIIQGIWMCIQIGNGKSSFTIPLGYIVDPLTSVMLFVVGFIGWWIMLYSVGYMRGDARYHRYFAYMSLFMASMLGLVLANNFVMLYICWELVGLCSYLLIGFWYEREPAMRACKKAFIVTRLGDTGFALGIFLIATITGSVLFYSIGNLKGVFTSIHDGSVKQNGLFALASALLFLGAIGKSAQFPLHVWLPDAMEGPTPVSALIHAATMVAAGVYMVARCYVLFDEHIVGKLMLLGNSIAISPGELVAHIGCFTAFMAATIALTQNDIKRILAYSTISQLGYMMMGLGLGAYSAGTFHLMTHAFFKALLFLCAGSVIHAMHTNEIFEMGGLKRAMPVTFATYLVGMGALAGIPPLSGFWSKDEILAHAFMHNKFLWAMGEVTAFLTALYMTRQLCVVFLGEQRRRDIHPHESPPVMLLPLFVLSFGAALSGLVGTPWMNLYGKFVTYGEAHVEGHPSSGFVMLISLCASITGVLFGYRLYGARRISNHFEDPLRLILGATYSFLEAKWHLDWYEGTRIRHAFFAIVNGCRGFDLGFVDGFINLVGWVVAYVFAYLHRLFDLYVVDGLVNGVALLTGFVGNVLRLIQTGLVRHYILFVLLGFAVLIAFSMWRVILLAHP
ncbi:MAG: NADH-quinone oxidoreductase subunit L [Armatimonadota bacterium]|nr:NADH-quinone oxidoreductase subunit L [Armatimonadota bacterium]MCX7776985.1 NADH-quinone oxidoreductase subunit L [Armatimonadota bacterium]MDW8024819.1 NADH-quinone oxidoreductase subunit L [Armatimonadota bacterium]